MTEEWKSISGFANYEVSTKGRIRSIKRIKKFKNGRLVQFESKIKLIRKHPKNGFLMTDLISDEGKRKTVYPHKMVALAFIKNENTIQNKVVVHKDDDLSNNQANNLKWSSYSESIRNGFKNGKRDNSTLWLKRRLKYGPQGGNKSTGRPDPLNYSQKKRILLLREKKGYTLKKLAHKYDCSVSHIHKTIKQFKKK